MGTLLKWLLLALLGVLLLSDIRLDTSLYRYADNRLEIAFPRWQSDSPWLYLLWIPGQGVFSCCQAAKTDLDQPAEIPLW